MSDEFDSPHERGEGDIPRDRWGRYLLPHPAEGKTQPWTRATTFAKSISDTFALSQWSQRMVAKGLTMRPDLLAVAHSLDVKGDRDKLNQVCEDAKAAAGNKVAANLGTALHSFSEDVDRGMAVSSVPEPHRGDIEAYSATMASAGLFVVPGMIERQTVLPAFEVGGTFDRILDLSHAEGWFKGAVGGVETTGDSEVIGDVKSGQDLQYGWNEIAIQLLIYALGVRTSGVWNRQSKSWEAPRPVRLDFAIVMHVPVGQRTATLYKLDLTDAMDALELCRSVRRWRKLRVLATPLERATMGETPPPAVTGLSWLERFQVAGSRGELSSLFHEAVAAGVWSATLEQAGKQRLALLEEKAG